MGIPEPPEGSGRSERFAYALHTGFVLTLVGIGFVAVRTAAQIGILRERLSGRR